MSMPASTSTIPAALRAQAPAPTHAAVQRRLALALGLWAGAAALLTARGVTERLPTRLLPVPVALGIAAPLLVYARVQAFRAYIHALDLRGLFTLFHLWRAPAALAFFYYGARGKLPAAFVRNAAWGDLIAALLAPAVVVQSVRAGRRPAGDGAGTRGFVGFNLFSFADFVVAVGTGIAFSLRGDARMSTLRRLPMALIPLFGVPVTGAFSLMALHRLFTRRA